MSLTAGHAPAVSRPGDVAAAEWDLLTDGVHWSDGAYRLLGRDHRLGPLTLDALPALLHSEDRPQLCRLVTRILVHGQAGSAVVRIRRPDGRTTALCCTGAPLLGGDGRATALRMLLRPV
ncbi:PAS domain-containing protein [Kitasatospora sp. NPDC085879]|jgi:PAS domain-containing protein|uniref:PAS domain-containing protein n=1 Tax=Kitasatospora sp. NPDC085879 TaxID=3154769 RepID=UPI000BB11339|nr:PAS domain-containing protein [Streptomyces sp. TLI_235]PBC71351.1 PAS domain-containing protein [Streptomyces sp. TLI_235]